MKQSNIPLYIRFGEIPEDGQSKVHRSDEIIRNEGGISVWKAVEDQGRYWPLLPDDPNENTIADYFSMLLDRYNSNRNVYLVTGTKLCIEGADREPLLMNVKIIKDISSYYRKNKKVEDKILKDLIKLGVLTKDGVSKYLNNKNKNEEELMMDKQKVVTLIGSMRFWDEFITVANNMEREGISVLMPIKDPDGAKSADVRSNLDKTIRKKIDMSDEVFVINIDKYVGPSTETEIKYAKSIGKPVKYLIPEKLEIITLCGSRRFKTDFERISKEFALKGKIVFTPAIFNIDIEEVGKLSTAQHNILDILHQNKILMSDKVLIVNPGGYIGDNTREEIKFAEAHNIEIEYLHEPITEEYPETTDGRDSE